MVVLLENSKGKETAMDFIELFVDVERLLETISPGLSTTKANCWVLT